MKSNNSEQEPAGSTMGDGDGGMANSISSRMRMETFEESKDPPPL